MPTMLKQQLLRPVVVIAASGIIALGVVIYVLVTTSMRPTSVYVHPTMGPVVEQVTTTGTVKAAQEVDLSFQTSGAIAGVYTDVGEHVGAGATLAALSSADQEAQLEQAQANVAEQQAKLESLQAGATSESVDAGQTAVTNAQAALAAAQQGVVQASQDAYVKSDDAIHNRVDQMFTNPRTNNPSFDLTLSNSQDEVSIQSQRVTMETLLSAWQAYEQQLATIDPSTSNVSDVVSKTRDYLSQMSSYLDLVSSGLSNAVPTGTYPAATIQGFQASIATARTDLSTDASTLNAASTALTSANSGLAAAQAQLAVTQEPATASDIAAQQAAVASAQAQVDLEKAQLGQTLVLAPISGTITVNNAHVGATVSPGALMFSMISDSSFQIETYVSEADLAKVMVGQPAEVTLDAYQSDVPLPAHVIKIDPAATISSGVASYKVTLQFDSNDPREKSGMSGSVVITTNSEPDVLTIPSSAIIRNGTSTSVLKQVNGADVLSPVTLGISGGGLTEIVTGLSATDEVRTFGGQQ